jgi:glycosyltransferase involved in cell wall biosynthesis
VRLANGTDAERIAFAGPAERQALRGKLEFGDTRLALFMGSGHWPNIEAVRRIFEFAVELPSIAFVVMGSVCYAFDPTLKPGNVLFLGEVDDVTRNLCLHACDVALNPMEHGSGTNIKMLDYFAAGLPVITSPSGARGLPLDDERYCLVRTIAEFPTVLQDSLGLGAEACARRAAAARRLVEERFDWHTIVQRVKPRLVGLADAELARRALTGRERLSAA